MVSSTLVSPFSAAPDANVKVHAPALLGQLPGPADPGTPQTDAEPAPPGGSYSRRDPDPKPGNWS